jgi:hypothetical protein
MRRENLILATTPRCNQVDFSTQREICTIVMITNVALPMNERLCSLIEAVTVVQAESCLNYGERVVCVALDPGKVT